MRLVKPAHFIDLIVADLIDHHSFFFFCTRPDDLLISTISRTYRKLRFRRDVPAAHRRKDIHCISRDSTFSIFTLIHAAKENLSVVPHYAQKPLSPTSQLNLPLVAIINCVSMYLRRCYAASIMCPAMPTIIPVTAVRCTQHYCKPHSNAFVADRWSRKATSIGNSQTIVIPSNACIPVSSKCALLSMFLTWEDVLTLSLTATYSR
jgi:hypothetical protein